MVTVPFGVKVCTEDVPFEFLCAVKRVFGEVLEVVLPMLMFQYIPVPIALAAEVVAMRVSTLFTVIFFPPLSRHEPNLLISSVVVAEGMDIRSLQR